MPGQPHLQYVRKLQSDVPINSQADSVALYATVTMHVLDNNAWLNVMAQAFCASLRQLLWDLNASIVSLPAAVHSARTTQHASQNADRQTAQPPPSLSFLGIVCHSQSMQVSLHLAGTSALLACR